MANTKFELMDIPLTCSVFLEPALKKYRDYIAPVSPTVLDLVHCWNRALMEILARPEFRPYLGRLGQRILKGATENDKIIERYVSEAPDVTLQSLHYVLRFSDSVNFLNSKKTINPQLSVVDLGSGFSPMAVVASAEYNINAMHMIDCPEIMYAYECAADKIGIKSPAQINWSLATNMATVKKIDTIVAMGVLPYMELDEQITRLKFINKNFDNFLLEIKYNDTVDANVSPRAFDLPTLQRLRLEVGSTDTIETRVFYNAVNYLRRFLRAKPASVAFVEKERSLFLSR